MSKDTRVIRAYVQLSEIQQTLDYLYHLKGWLRGWMDATKEMKTHLAPCFTEAISYTESAIQHLEDLAEGLDEDVIHNV